MNRSFGKKFAAWIIVFTLPLLIASCSSEQKLEAHADPLAIELSDPDLIQGKEVWTGRCQVCHHKGLNEAPIIGRSDLWAPRIAKGIDTLYSHALNGFVGPEYNEMPAKGGFTELSDDQVKSAVRFMVSVSQ